MSLTKLMSMKELNRDNSGNLVLDGVPVNATPIGVPFCISIPDEMRTWGEEAFNDHIREQIVWHSCSAYGEKEPYQSPDAFTRSRETGEALILSHKSSVSAVQLYKLS